MKSVIALGLMAVLIAGAAQGVDLDPRDQLMAADRRFAAAVAEGGFEAWMSFMADDAVRLDSLGAVGVQGKDAIAKVDAALFADPHRLLTWEPRDGAAFAGGDLGYTTGHYRLIRRDDHGAEVETLGRGRYITWWRRGADGTWQVILDTGEADAAS